MFSISPHARFEFRNPLSVPEANPEVLRLAVANSFENPEWDSTSLVKSPNCVTCGVAIALRALDAKFGGVCDVSITTFQSLSGRGDAKYPKELVMGNVYPLKGTVERTGEYQKAELRRIMPSIGKISIAAYRVPVQKGHLVDIRVSFKKREPGVEKPTSQQIHDAFVEFDPELGARGIKVFSISPHARFEFRNPLSVPEANPEVLRLAVANSFENPEWDSTSLVKSPNCVTCGVAIALRALDAKFGGVCDVSITTFQSLSGRGDAKYPKELVMGNVYPLKGTVERTGEYQKAELRRIMPSIGKISIAAYRVPVQKGHLVDIRVSFKKREPGVEKPTSQQIHDAFVEFDPLRDAPLPSKPTRLIRVKPLDVAVDDDRSADAIDRPPRLGTPRPKDDCEFENGMSIVVGNIDTTDDLFDVTFCVVVNNVARGAWGAALLNAEYWSFLRGRRFPKESEPAE